MPQDANPRREDVTVVPSAYYDGLLADLEARDERNERVAAAHRRLGGVVQQVGSASNGDLVKVRLSEGTYVLPGASVEELDRLRPTLDAMNAPSHKQARE